MVHVFSFGVWGSLHLSVCISMPRQSKLSESKQLWDWPGLVMEPPSKKAQIPSFGHLFPINVWWFKKKRVDLHKMMQLLVWKTQHIIHNTWGRFSPRIGMSCHFLKHHAVVFTLWPARQRWVPLWKLQSWHFGSIPALRWYYESKLQVHPINPPC